MAKYNNTNKIDQDYFSGTQTAIYIGDMWVDDIYGIEFQPQGGMRPVFGYKSPNFDLLLRENEIIIGSFAMNFKDSAYLYLILDRYTKKKVSLDERIHRISAATESQPTVVGETQTQPAPTREEVSAYNSRVEDVLRSQEIPADQKTVQATRELYNIKTTREPVFEELVNNYELAVWGEEKRADNPVNSMNFKNRPTAATNPKLRGLQNSPFNITITYGNIYSKDEISTVEMLQDVVLTGCNKVIDVSGNPVQERYSFIARRAF